MIITIDECFLQITGAATARLTVLYPELKFDVDGAKVIVTGENVEARASEITKSVLNTLYQEKIFQETLEIRKRIYNG